MFWGILASAITHCDSQGIMFLTGLSINTGTGLCCSNTKFKRRSAGDTLLSLSHGRNQKTRDMRHFIATEV